MATPADLPVVCEHLRPVLAYALERGFKVAFAGQAWSSNCRLWVYVDALLDTDALIARFALPAVVQTHTHRGTHDGMEHGLVCTEHNDAIMGRHPAEGQGERLG